MARGGGWAASVGRAGLAVAALLWSAQPEAAYQSVAPEPANGIIGCSQPRSDGGGTWAEYHNPGLVAGHDADYQVCFEGFVSLFDGGDRSRERGKEFWRIPHFVVHRIDRDGRNPKTEQRPRSWFTVDSLAATDDKIAPTDDSYRFAAAFRAAHPNWYDRGHQAQQYMVARLGPKTGLYSNNLANAVPQLHRFNAYPWLDAECRTGAWANRFEKLWVVSGPVFLSGKPLVWMNSGLKKSLDVAVPDALFKVAIRVRPGGGFETVSFLLPQQSEAYFKKKGRDINDYRTSLARIEALTGLRFFPAPEGASKRSDWSESQALWPVRRADFDAGCKSFGVD
ncbi:MAG: hypothetical protein GC191_00390 [Azospirillum sp.]|nr:hypothetical protein [Azospirillum sp.]